jgi:hypothetical protein
LFWLDATSASEEEVLVDRGIVISVGLRGVAIAEGKAQLLDRFLGKELWGGLGEAGAGAAGRIFVG